jgi:hypothetical protein
MFNFMVLLPSLQFSVKSPTMRTEAVGIQSGRQTKLPTVIMQTTHQQTKLPTAFTVEVSSATCMFVPPLNLFVFILCITEYFYFVSFLN